MGPYRLVWFHRALKRHPARLRFAEKNRDKNYLLGGFSPGNHHEFSGTTIWRCSRRSATSFARTRSISCSKQHG